MPLLHNVAAFLINASQATEDSFSAAFIFGQSCALLPGLKSWMLGRLMKMIITLFLSFFFCTILSQGLWAQQTKFTVILLRHAEKDVSVGADQVNPDLAPEGKLRAQKLVKAINKYKPNVIYSSNFTRTKATVAPLAEKRKLTVQIYDHRKLSELADLMMEGKAKCVVVVGHNTTTPALANLLLKQEKYPALAETVYNKIWIIKIKKNKTKPNKIEDKIIEY